jgi:16S rRNA (cytidine1402-2'-O)-methyltransferase
MARNDRDANGEPTGKLCVVATPLGNPDDLSPRARATLAGADVILAEDTRSARRLLADAGLPADLTGKLMSCFDANESDRAAEAVTWVAAGRCVVVISEAGTPLVSDPGFRVAAAVAAAGLRVEPIPGPSALLAALVGSGLSPDHFTFLGFPPRKCGARRRLFESLRTHPFTLILYESPMRTADTLADLAAVLGGERRACVARELTKTYEEFVRDTLAALAEKYRVDRPLGEVTLVVAGATSDAPAEAFTDEALEAEAQDLLASGLSARDTSTELASRSGRPRREVYALVTAVAGRSKPES